MRPMTCSRNPRGLPELSRGLVCRAEALPRRLITGYPNGVKEYSPGLARLLRPARLPWENTPKDNSLSSLFGGEGQGEEVPFSAAAEALLSAIHPHDQLI